MKAASLEIKKEELSFRIQDVRQRPNLSLIAGVNQAEQSSTSLVTTQRTYVGLNVGWNLFDGYETRGRRLASVKRLRLLRESKERIESELLEGAEHREDRVGFAAQAVRFSFDWVDRAKGGVKYWEEEHQAGRASDKNIEDAKRSLNQQELALMKTQRDYLNLLADFVSWIGEDPAMKHFKYLTK